MNTQLTKPNKIQPPNPCGSDSARIAQMARACVLGEIQSHGPVSVIPIVEEGLSEGPDYLSLGEAMDSASMVVTEVSEEGFVPILKVRNLSPSKILLLDGEELEGAKQNRVLNTTVLIPAEQEVTIPVSCSERGRWRYKGKFFEDSGVIMAKKAQYHKSSSVSVNLKSNESYASNQGQVWESINCLYSKYQDSFSPTEAMHDVFKQKESLLEDYLDHFPCVEGQRGMVLFAEGELVGCEVLSRTGPYRRCHPKIVKSFCIDLLDLPVEKDDKMGSSEKATEWLDSIENWKSERFKSLGEGEDLRLKNGVSHGNALVAEDTVVHFVGFAPHVIRDDERGRSERWGMNREEGRDRSGHWDEL